MNFDRLYMCSFNIKKYVFKHKKIIQSCFVSYGIYHTDIDLSAKTC